MNRPAWVKLKGRMDDSGRPGACRTKARSLCPPRDTSSIPVSERVLPPLSFCPPLVRAPRVSGLRLRVCPRSSWVKSVRQHQVNPRLDRERVRARHVEISRCPGLWVLWRSSSVGRDPAGVDRQLTLPRVKFRGWGQDRAHSRRCHPRFHRGSSGNIWSSSLWHRRRSRSNFRRSQGLHVL